MTDLKKIGCSFCSEDNVDYGVSFCDECYNYSSMRIHKFKDRFIMTGYKYNLINFHDDDIDLSMLPYEILGEILKFLGNVLLLHTIDKDMLNKMCVDEKLLSRSYGFKKLRPVYIFKDHIFHKFYNQKHIPLIKTQDMYTDDFIEYMKKLKEDKVTVINTFDNSWNTLNDDFFNWFGSNF